LSGVLGFVTCTNSDNVGLVPYRPIISKTVGRSFHMAMNQVVLYFDKQEDALLFTVAASSIMSDEGALPSSAAGNKMALEISKANRITTESVRNIT
jgi:hypothetical protein